MRIQIPSDHVEGPHGTLKLFRASSFQDESVAISAACETVFYTTELLEQILLHLPFERIFTFRRVCWYWKNTISDSPSIRYKTYLEPNLHTAPRDPWLTHWRFDKYLLQNPPPDLHFDVADGAHSRDIASILSNHKREVFTKRPKYFVPATLHPYLKVLDYPYGITTSRSIAKRLFKNDGDWCEFLELPSLNDQGSWKRMYLTDPPCQCADLDLKFELYRPDVQQGSAEATYHGTVINANGLTFGDIAHDLLHANSPRYLWGEPRWLPVDRVLKRYEQETGLNLTVKILSSRIELFGVVIPTRARAAACKTVHSV